MRGRALELGTESSSTLPAQPAGQSRLMGQKAVVLVPLALIVAWEVLKIGLKLPDTRLPHLWDILATFGRPTPRGLVIVGMVQDAAYTWLEAFAGLLLGGLAGFFLASLFTHYKLLERGLLPYVIASQTVPIIAIAPMVVVWLGTSWVSKAVIAAYLTFFPVTVNTLRGLESVDPDALDLMHSYAATERAIFVKLRLPSALPYIFTALRVSATASVIGAIIGELPVGSTRGLGVAIINGSQYYTFQPHFLWATIFVACAVGIGFYLIVVIAERFVIRWEVSAEE